MTKLFTLITVLLLNIQLIAQSANPPSKEELEKELRTIFVAMCATKPVLCQNKNIKIEIANPTPANKLTAQAISADNKIEFGLPFLVDCFHTFPNDKVKFRGALAFILGHELSHLDLKHASGKKRDEEQEKQADREGIYLALNAGYQVCGVLDKLLEMMYSKYQNDRNCMVGMKDRLSKTDRFCEECNHTADMFKAANISFLLGYPTVAKNLYAFCEEEKGKCSYKAPEIIFNKAICNYDIAIEKFSDTTQLKALMTHRNLLAIEYSSLLENPVFRKTGRNSTEDKDDSLAQSQLTEAEMLFGQLPTSLTAQLTLGVLHSKYGNTGIVKGIKSKILKLEKNSLHSSLLDDWEQYFEAPSQDKLDAICSKQFLINTNSSCNSEQCSILELTKPKFFQIAGKTTYQWREEAQKNGERIYTSSPDVKPHNTVYRRHIKENNNVILLYEGDNHQKVFLMVKADTLQSQTSSVVADALVKEHTTCVFNFNQNTRKAYIYRNGDTYLMLTYKQKPNSKDWAFDEWLVLEF